MERMKTDFPPTTNWSLARLEDMRGWLPRLSQLPPTRELTILSFDIRQSGTIIADLDSYFVSVASAPPADDVITSTDNLSLKPATSSPLPVMRPTRANRRKTTTTEISDGAESDEVLRIYDSVTASPVGVSIRVKRATRSKQSLGEVENADEGHFPNKVSTSTF